MRLLVLRSGFTLLLLTAAASAQTPAIPPVSPTGDDLKPAADTLAVSLLTMLPGHEVYSLFGHSAIRIRSDVRGLDRTYNFGTFDFDQPFFMVRFARGQLDYMLDTAPFADELAKYEYLGRPIIEQRLALSPQAAERLLANLEDNARPENRNYRYDFLFDNCATRLLDVIERAAADAGQGALALAPSPEHPTFRDLLYRNTRGTPTIAMGMNLAVGMPADRTTTDREQTFLPVGLAAALDGATVGGRPLVVSRDTLFWVPGAGEVPDRPEPFVPAVLAFLALGWIAAWARPARFATLGRIADAILFTVAAIAGLVVAFLWFATDHTVTGPNLNLLWAFPAHLWLAFGKPSRARRIYAGLAAAGAVTALIVHVAGIQILPTGAVLAAIAVAFRAARIATIRHGEAGAQTPRTR